MLKRFASLAALTLLLGTTFVPAAHADTRFSLRVGPVYGAYDSRPRPVWQPGYRVWTGYHYRWVPGRWVTTSYGRYDWRRERWEREHRQSYRGRDKWRDQRWNGDHDRRDWRR
jgi:hypothetical protein